MNTYIGNTVLDTFMGSGTTGVACANLERNFIGTKLDSEYYEIATERINLSQKYPGAVYKRSKLSKYKKLF
jgi:DNA modification methylase